MRRLLVLCVLAACSDPSFDAVSVGDQTYDSACARCHGQDGRGGVTAPGQVAPRDLTDPAWQASLGDGQLEAIIRQGRGTMPPFGKALSWQRIQALVVKIRRMRGSAR